jgi:hypothetical protein
LIDLDAYAPKMLILYLISPFLFQLIENKSPYSIFAVANPNDKAEQRPDLEARAYRTNSLPANPFPFLPISPHPTSRPEASGPLVFL